VTAKLTAPSSCFLLWVYMTPETGQSFEIMRHKDHETAQRAGRVGRQKVLGIE
jgi:hypothetical protein